MAHSGQIAQSASSAPTHYSGPDSNQGHHAPILHPHQLYMPSPMCALPLSRVPNTTTTISTHVPGHMLADNHFNSFTPAFPEGLAHDSTGFSPAPPRQMYLPPNYLAYHQARPAPQFLIPSSHPSAHPRPAQPSPQAFYYASNPNTGIPAYPASAIYASLAHGPPQSSQPQYQPQQPRALRAPRPQPAPLIPLSSGPLVQSPEPVFRKHASVKSESDHEDVASSTALISSLGTETKEMLRRSELYREDRLRSISKYKPGWAWALTSDTEGVRRVSDAEYAEDLDEIGRVRTRCPPGQESSDEARSETQEGSSDDEEVKHAARNVVRRSGRKPRARSRIDEDLSPAPAPNTEKGPRKAATTGKPAWQLQGTQLTEGLENRRKGRHIAKRGEAKVQEQVCMEEEEEDEEQAQGPEEKVEIPRPLPFEFVVAEAERQSCDTQYRSIRSVTTRALQLSEALSRLKIHAVKALQSLCKREGQHLSNRRRRLQMLQDVIQALDKRWRVEERIKQSSAALREKIDRRRKLCNCHEPFVLPVEESETDSSDEELEEEQPVLKNQHEPLEAYEEVVLADESEGVVQSLRRGIVVVDKADGSTEVLKLDAVRRKHAAPPGFPSPNPSMKLQQPGKAQRDLLLAWNEYMEHTSDMDEEADQALRRALEKDYNDFGLKDLLEAHAAEPEPLNRVNLGPYAGPPMLARSRRRADSLSQQKRPLVFTVAIQDNTPLETPLLVSPCVEPPEHILGVYHGKRKGHGIERMVHRTSDLRRRVLSERFRQWEMEKKSWTRLKSDVARLESKVRTQKHRTSDVQKWLNEVEPTRWRLSQQFDALAGEVEALKYRHRTELRIAQIETPRNYQLPSRNVRPAQEANLGRSVSGTLDTDEDEEDPAAKRRRLEQEEAELEKEAEAEEQLEEAPSTAFPMRARGTSFAGRGGLVKSENEEDGEGVTRSDAGLSDAEAEEAADLGALLVHVRSGSFAGSPRGKIVPQDGHGGVGVEKRLCLIGCTDALDGLAETAMTSPRHGARPKVEGKLTGREDQKGAVDSEEGGSEKQRRGQGELMEATAQAGARDFDSVDNRAKVDGAGKPGRRSRQGIERQSETGEQQPTIANQEVALNASAEKRRSLRSSQSHTQPGLASSNVIQLSELQPADTASIQSNSSTPMEGRKSPTGPGREGKKRKLAVRDETKRDVEVFSTGMDDTPANETASTRNAVHREAKVEETEAAKTAVGLLHEKHKPKRRAR